MKHGKEQMMGKTSSIQPSESAPIPALDYSTIPAFPHFPLCSSIDTPRQASFATRSHRETAR